MSSHTHAQAQSQNDPAGAEIVRGTEACYNFITDLLRDLRFPRGVLPPRDLEEVGMVRETGFVWMRASDTHEHLFESIKGRASYAREVTAYVEMHRMSKIVGVKIKNIMVWVPLAEMVVEGPERNKVRFTAYIRIGVSYPFSAFKAEEEKHKIYLENITKINK